MQISTLLFLVLAGVAGSCQGHVYNKEGWAAASAYLREAMDESVDPCEDFWGFMCGKWNRTEELNLRSQHVKNRKMINAEVLEALEKVDVNDPGVPKFKKSLKTFYEKCVSRTKSEEDMVRDIYDNLERYFMPKIAVRKTAAGNDVYPWEDDDTGVNGTLGSMFWNFVGRLQKEQNTFFLLRATLFTVPKGCQKQPTLLLSPHFKLDLEESMLKVFFHKIFGSYHNVTISEQDISDTYDEMRTFQTKLYSSYFSGDMSEDTEHLLTLDELAFKVPDIDWYAYMEGLLPEDIKKTWLRGNVTLNVFNLEHFKRVVELINKFPKVTVYNVGFAAVIQNYYNLFMKGEFK